MKQYLCIDIGGTAIKYGILDETEIFLECREMPTRAYLGGSSIVKRVMGIVEEFVKKSAIQGICISTAGMVDTEKGRIFYSAPLIPGYGGTEWKRTLEDAFGIPCEVENDVNCMGLAESISGAARDSSLNLCLTVGTGIGGCFVIDKEVYRGYSGSACEIGYMHVFDSDFQTLGAASTLAAKAAARKKEPEEKWDGRRVFEAAKGGDAECRDAIDEMADILGRGIANICYVLNPQTVVLGGGIMAQKEYMYSRVRKSLDRYLLPAIASKTTLKMAEHGNRAGMLGAYYHFQNCRKKGKLWEAM